MNEDNLCDTDGYHIFMTTMPSYPDFIKWHARYYGDGFFGRLWAQCVRPLASPKMHKLIRACFKVSKIKLDQEFKDAVIQSGLEMPE